MRPPRSLTRLTALFTCLDKCRSLIGPPPSAFEDQGLIKNTSFRNISSLLGSSFRNVKSVLSLSALSEESDDKVPAASDKDGAHEEQGAGCCSRVSSTAGAGPSPGSKWNLVKSQMVETKRVEKAFASLRRSHSDTALADSEGQPASSVAGGLARMFVKTLSGSDLAAQKQQGTQYGKVSWQRRTRERLRGCSLRTA